jgi:hypothetical protein
MCNCPPRPYFEILGTFEGCSLFDLERFVSTPGDARLRRNRMQRRRRCNGSSTCTNAFNHSNTGTVTPTSCRCKADTYNQCARLTTHLNSASLAAKSGDDPNSPSSTPACLLPARLTPTPLAGRELPLPPCNKALERCSYASINDASTRGAESATGLLLEGRIFRTSFVVVWF